MSNRTVASPGWKAATEDMFSEPLSSPSPVKGRAATRRTSMFVKRQITQKSVKTSVQESTVDGQRSDPKKAANMISPPLTRSRRVARQSMAAVSLKQREEISRQARCQTMASTKSLPPTTKKTVTGVAAARKVKSVLSPKSTSRASSAQVVVLRTPYKTLKTSSINSPKVEEQTPVVAKPAEKSPQVASKDSSPSRSKSINLQTSLNQSLEMETATPVSVSKTVSKKKSVKRLAKSTSQKSVEKTSKKTSRNKENITIQRKATPDRATQGKIFKKTVPSEYLSVSGMKSVELNMRDGKRVLGGTLRQVALQAATVATIATPEKAIRVLGKPRKKSAPSHDITDAPLTSTPLKSASKKRRIDDPAISEITTRKRSRKSLHTVAADTTAVEAMETSFLGNVSGAQGVSELKPQRNTHGWWWCNIL